MLEHLEGFAKKISDLADRPNASMSSTELKAWFDAAPEELREFLNTKLTQIDNEFALKSELTSTTLGQILDGSLTDAKLSNAEGQVKDKLDKNIQELSDFKEEINTSKGASNGFATLDSSKNIPVNQLGNAAKMITGTYTGNGSTSRSISVGLQPKFLYVHGFNSSSAIVQWFAGAINQASIASSGHSSSAHFSLTATGFNINNDYANSSGKVYEWFAFA